jgi:hypothetical protein
MSLDSPRTRTRHRHARPKLAALALAVLFAVSTFFALGLSPHLTANAQAIAIYGPDFQRVWNRTDKQVATGAASRTWLWGPEPFMPALIESYEQSPEGRRVVQYFDKSRMEINNPNGDKNSPFYVTNGLIAIELMSGRMQTGDNRFEDRGAAQVNVAGDPDDTNGPTYAALDRVRKPAASDETGQTIVATINRAGDTAFEANSYGAQYGVKNAFYEASAKQNIAKPFWDFLNLQTSVLNDAGQPVNGRLFEPVFYATGLPVTGAYWAKVKVGGTVKDVLVQAFERRVLTYTPSNSAAFQVEMGNIGRHYYQWRYTPDVQPVIAPPLIGNPTPTPPTPATNPPRPAVSCLPALSGNETRSGVANICMTNPTPNQRADNTVYVRFLANGKPVSGVPMNAVWRYKSTAPTCSGVTDNDGVASCTRNIGDATEGFEIKVQVSLNYNGQNYTAETSFTPR